jgi:hypothetical protein
MVVVTALVLVCVGLLDISRSSSGAASRNVIILSADNFKQTTNGKTVLIKFAEPKCAVCKEVLNPSWDKLSEMFAHYSYGLIAEVDCSNPRGQVLCRRFNVTEIPTILYGDPLQPKEYTGGYDYRSLSTFAKRILSKPVCHVTRKNICDEDTKKIIKELLSKSLDQLTAQKTEIDKRIEDFWNTSHNMFQFNHFVTKVEDESNYRWIQQVLAARHKVPIEETKYKWSEQSDEADDDAFIDERLLKQYDEDDDGLDEGGFVYEDDDLWQADLMNELMEAAMENEL